MSSFKYHYWERSNCNIKEESFIRSVLKMLG